MSPIGVDPYQRVSRGAGGGLCMYVIFHPPGPSESDMGSEVMAIANVVHSNFGVDVRRCPWKTAIAPIEDVNQCDQAQIGVMMMLQAMGKDAPIQSVGLNTSNPAFPKVQVAWATG